MGTRIATALVLVTFAASAHAVSPPIMVRDLPGTRGEWQEGVALVPAPAAQVQAWLTDYNHWRGRFPDIEWSQYLGDDPHGRHMVRFRSKVAGRTFVIHESVKRGLLVFDGWAPDVHTQGRVWILDAGGGQTRVIMQSTAEVHGFIGWFASKSHRRKASFAATTSQLRGLLDLAHAR